MKLISICALAALPAMAFAEGFVPAGEAEFTDIVPGVVAFATVAGDRESGAHGTFVRIPKGQKTPLHTHGGAYDAVVIEGIFENPIDGDPSSVVRLGPGSYYHVPADAAHVSGCAEDSPTDCLTYFHQATGFDFEVAQ